MFQIILLDTEFYLEKQKKRIAACWTFLKLLHKINLKSLLTGHQKHFYCVICLGIKKHSKLFPVVYLQIIALFSIAFSVDEIHTYIQIHFHYFKNIDTVFHIWYWTLLRFVENFSLRNTDYSSRACSQISLVSMALWTRAQQNVRKIVQYFVAAHLFTATYNAESKYHIGFT